MSIVLNALIRKTDRIPRYGWFYGAAMIAFQSVCYYGGHFLSVATGTINNAWCPVIPAIDGRIPFVPVFILIYIFSYVFWYCGHVAVTITGKASTINYTIGLCAAYLIGLVIYAAAPTYMIRQDLSTVRTIGDMPLLTKLTQFIYDCDGGTTAFDLLPSFHCLSSLYAFLGIKHQKDIPLPFRIYTFIMAVLVFLSTVLVRQHYILDGVASLAIDLLCYVITKKLNPAASILKKYGNQ